LAEVAAALGVPGAEWRRAPAGLWLGAAKLGACGIHVRHRVASHGWALNIDTPADAWRLIVPCGMADACITSIAAQRAGRGLGPPPPMSTIAALAAGHLARALGYEATPTALGVLVAATLR
jgi:lipoyl(octanoyl) transferase